MRWIAWMMAVIGLGLTASGADAPPGESVHRIELPKYQSDLPDAEGREAFATACLSCHSTAYIRIQPPFTAARWEEEVRKMQKTYNAPIGEDQIAPIVKYLMAVKEGTGPHIRETQVTPAGEAELILPSTDKNQREKEIERGEGVFAQLCSSCHGVDGRGNGPAGLVLLPRPADLTAGKFSDEGVSLPICRGVPGTAMPAFGKIPKADLRAVESYVLSLTPDDPPPAKPTPEAKQLYLQNCATCHGPDGRGDGLASAALPRSAANFHLRRPSADYAKQIISDGLPGTAMPAWKSKLTDQQQTTLAEYVRGFFKEDK